MAYMPDNQHSVSNKRIIFAGVARDCEKYLNEVLDNIEKLSSLFQEAAFVFVENDSKDGTKKILSTWGLNRKNFFLINLDGLGQIPVRALRLETARNVYAEFVKTDVRFNDYDYLCIMDMDDVNTMQIDKSSFWESLDFLEETENCAGVFANQIGTYYDMWTIRHKELCPVDVWYEALEYAHVHKASDQEAFNQTFAKRILSFAPSLPPIEVDSAFGGLGIYKLQYVRNNQNPYLGSRIKVVSETGGQIKIFRTQVCEHVHFNVGIRQQGGRLFVLPGLINADMSDFSFNCSYLGHIVF